jgi:hypothetical protein
MAPSASLVVPTPAATPTPPPTTVPTPTAPPPPSSVPTSRATPPPVVATGPASQVVRFYDVVAAHQFDTAAALWSSGMRSRYPPSTYIDGRFANTTAFDVRRAALASQSGDRATVAVDIVEHRSTSPTREHWVGSWSLVLQDGRWLLDDPNLAAAA